MADDSNQRAVHRFLVEHFKNQTSFAQEEMRAQTDWSDKSFRGTYWLKHYRPFVAPVGTDFFRVTEAFRPYLSWRRFQQHVTQVRSASSDYDTELHEHLIIYEFFMPLTHEESLRSTLDALFYRETILSRLRSHEVGLAHHFSRAAGEESEDHFNRAADWAAEQFGGYSVSHVSGRFRNGTLLDLARAASLQLEGERYLVDETTAIVRFIFPVRGRPRKYAALSEEYFEALAADSQPEATEVTEQAARIRWFFGILFIQSIVQAVSGEAEIWMVETGLRNRLHIWKVRDDSK